MLRRSQVQRIVRTVTSAAIVVAAATPSAQQAQPQSPPTAAGQPAPAARQRPETPMDPDRARDLYVSNDPRTTPAATTSSATSMRRRPPTRGTPRPARASWTFEKVTYRSSVGDMDIPAYLFQPLKKRGAEGARRDDLGARRRPRQLGHRPCSRSSRRPSSAATSSSAPSTAAARATAKRTTTRSTTAATKSTTRMSAVEYLKTLPHVDQDRLGHDGMEPRRLHHAVLRLPRHASVQGGSGDGAGDQPRVPAVLQRARLPAAVFDAVADPGPAVREA